MDLHFSINLPSSKKEFINLITDYENFYIYLSKQLQNLKIIKQDNNETTTEETFFLKSLKISITQQTVHKKMSENQFCWEIITGPVKGTITLISFKNSNPGTLITVDTNLKLGLKLKIFSPIIKKQYTKILMGIFYKMNTNILNKTNKV